MRELARSARHCDKDRRILNKWANQSIHPRSFIPNSATNNNKLGLVRQNSLPVAVKSMEEDKKQGVSKKREGSPTVFESSKNPNKKHISWAPLPIKGED
jgi:hypothetical protein